MTPAARQSQSNSSTAIEAQRRREDEALRLAPLEMNRLLERIAAALEGLLAVQGGLAKAHHNRPEQDRW